jgi:hypothetical protein
VLFACSQLPTAPRLRGQPERSMQFGR